MPSRRCCRPLYALYHAVITLKDLPPNELAAWRNMFDHYVFGDNGDPVEHLPKEARGLLGKRTPELVARVKKLLIGRAQATDFAFHFRSALS